MTTRPDHALPATPGEIELYSHFSQHLGPRYEAAGLRVQFHYNQTPGIHFCVPVPEQYRASIMRGIQEGMVLRFPNFPATILGVLATVAITALCVVLNPQDRSASSVGIIIILFLPGGIVAGLIVGAIASKRKGRK